MSAARGGRQPPGGLGGLPGGGGIGTQQNGLGSELGPASTKDTENRASVSHGRQVLLIQPCQNSAGPCPGHSELCPQLLRLWGFGRRERSQMNS